METIETFDMNEIAQMQTAMVSMRTDIDKLKNIVSDKVSKAVLSELEAKINTHTKSLDATTKKLFELQTNFNAFAQQPMSHTLIETIRKQLTEEIMENTRQIITEQTDRTRKLIDEKFMETRNMISNTKKFMYH